MAPLLSDIKCQKILSSESFPLKVIFAEYIKLFHGFEPHTVGFLALLLHWFCVCIPTGQWGYSKCILIPLPVLPFHRRWLAPGWQLLQCYCCCCAGAHMKPMLKVCYEYFSSIHSKIITYDQWVVVCFEGVYIEPTCWCVRACLEGVQQECGKHIVDEHH